MIKAEEIYHSLRNLAKNAEDKKHTVLFISSDISKYIRNEVRKKTQKDLENTIFDLDMGFITEEEAQNDIEFLNVILRSL